MFSETTEIHETFKLQYCLEGLPEGYKTLVQNSNMPLWALMCCCGDVFSFFKHIKVLFVFRVQHISVSVASNN